MGIEHLLFFGHSTYQSNDINVVEVGCGVKVITRLLSKEFCTGSRWCVNKYFVLKCRSQWRGTNCFVNCCFNQFKMMTSVSSFDSHRPMAHHKRGQPVAAVN